MSNSLSDVQRHDRFWRNVVSEMGRELFPLLCPDCLDKAARSIEAVLDRAIAAAPALDTEAIARDKAQREDFYGIEMGDRIP